jgi:hypothetical protein
MIGIPLKSIVMTITMAITATITIAIKPSRQWLENDARAPKTRHFTRNRQLPLQEVTVPAVKNTVRRKLNVSIGQ